MTLIFKYVGKYEAGKFWKAPLVPVHIRDKNGNLLEVEAIIDSGADNVVVPKRLAKLFDLEEQERSISEGIGGVVETRKSQLSMIIKTDDEAYALKLPVMILQDEKSDIPLVLGRGGFFDCFHITFKQNEELIILERAGHGI